MTLLKKFVLTSCAFLALAVVISVVTAPYFREAERERITKAMSVLRARS